MNKIFKNPIILALDVNSLTKALSIISDLKDHIGGVKLGMEFLILLDLMELERFRSLIFQFS